MLTKTRLILSALVLSASLIACSDNVTDTSSESNNAIGQTEQATLSKLGPVSYSQTHTIDALTITHSEWTDEKGTTSIQFHNGIAQYSQFTASQNTD